jgi:hypothetical protein
VQIQVEVFDEKLHHDQAELENDSTSFSLQQLFDIISAKVRDTSLSCNSRSLCFSMYYYVRGREVHNHCIATLCSVAELDLIPLESTYMDMG